MKIEDWQIKSNDIKFKRKLLFIRFILYTWMIFSDFCFDENYHFIKEENSINYAIKNNKYRFTRSKWN